MKGQFAIPKEEVKQNQMGWNEYDFLFHELRRYRRRMGWYAKKLENGIYYFKWADYIPSVRYLKALKDDGWKLAHSIKNIQNID